MLVEWREYLKKHGRSIHSGNIGREVEVRVDRSEVQGEHGEIEQGRK